MSVLLSYCKCNPTVACTSGGASYACKLCVARLYACKLCVARLFFKIVGEKSAVHGDTHFLLQYNGLVFLE